MYVYCDLELWPLTSKINRVHPPTMANMSAKFDEEAHNGLVSILFTSLLPYMSVVTLNFDLWPPKSIGSTLALANMSAKFNEEAHNGLVSIVFTSLFPYMSIVTLNFDLWPPKSKGSSYYHSKHVCQVWWKGILRFSFYCVHKVNTWTHRTTATLLYPHRNALRVLYPHRNALLGDNKWLPTCQIQKLPYLQLLTNYVNTKLFLKIHVLTDGGWADIYYSKV